MLESRSISSYLEGEINPTSKRENSMSCDNPDCRKMGCAVTYILPEMLVDEINGIKMTETNPIGPVDEDGNPPKRQDVGQERVNA